MSIISTNLRGGGIEFIYFICILNFVLILYLLYKDLTQQKEHFDATTDAIRTAINTRYGADVEAIRNLSDLASRLIAGGLTVPGNLGVNGDFVLSGTNQWVFHTPDDGRERMYIAPGIRDQNGSWNWGKSVTIDYDGTVTINGNLNVTGYINVTGNSTVTGNNNILGDLVLDGTNQWIFHTPNDGRTSLYIAPMTSTGHAWHKGLEIVGETGNLNVNGGNLNVNGDTHSSRGKGIVLYDLNGNSTRLSCNIEPNKPPTKFNISFTNAAGQGVGGDEVYANNGNSCWWKGRC